LHEQTDRQVAIQQEIKNRLPAFAVAGRIFVGNQENIDAVGFTQKNDFIYDLAGITEPPVIARTRSADGTQTGIGNDEIFVLLPIKQIPCCRQIIQTPGNDSFGGLYDIPVSTKGKPGDIVRTATIFQRLEQLLEGHLSFAADDVVNSRRRIQHLFVAEGGMNPAENSDNLRVDAFGKLKGLDGIVKGGSNGSRGNVRGVGLAEVLFDFRIAMVLIHGIINFGVETCHTGRAGQIHKTELHPAPDHIHDTAAIRWGNEKDLAVFQVEPILSPSHFRFLYQFRSCRSKAAQTRFHGIDTGLVKI